MKRPFLWSARRHAAMRAICASRWGLDVDPAATGHLAAAVERAYGASDALSMGEFTRRIRNLPDADPEVQAFVAVIVVGETSFFRNRPQFDALEHHVLPRLISARREDGTRRLRVWSAACSTGEEPYSIAMLLTELIPDLAAWDVQILGTDLNAQSLRRAQAAVYSAWAFRELDADRTKRYFTAVESRRTLAHPCKALVHFAQLNLANAHFPGRTLGSEPFDLILCRNVTIYFRREAVKRVIALCHTALARGGWLAVGHAEPDTQLFADFEEVELSDAFMYRKSEPVVGGANPVFEAPSVASPVADDRSTLEACAFEATEAFDESDPEHSNARLVALADAHPADPTAPHLLAQLAADAGRYDDALFWAFTSLQRDALHAPTLLLVGLVHLERGETERAKRSFRQAVFLEPDAPEAHLYLSMALAASGDDRGAERHKARARALAPDAPPPDPLPVRRARLALRDETSE